MTQIDDVELLDFDFDLEVEETKVQITKTEAKIEVVDNKAGKLVSKLDMISKNFDIAAETANALSDIVMDEVNEVKNLPTMNVGDIFQLELLQSDFMSVRGTLIDTVTKGKMVIDSLTNEIIMNPTNAELVMGYSQLINVVNSSMKLLTSTYKDISDIVVKVKKLEEASGPSKQVNIQNNFYAESTSDIIKQLRG